MRPMIVEGRNETLYAAMIAGGFRRPSDLAKAAGIRQAQVSHLMHQRIPPVVRGGGFCKPLKAIASVLKKLPEDLIAGARPTAAAKPNLHSPVVTDDDSCGFEAIHDQWRLTTAAAPQEVLAHRREIAERLRGLLRLLTERERAILAFRFADEPMTRDAIGVALGISGNLVNDIERRALKKLRDRAETRRITIDFGVLA